MIFAQIVPEVDASNGEIILGAAILIAIDSVLGLWTARRSKGVTSIVLAFFSLGLANVTVVFVANLLVGEDELHLGNTLFFVMLLTLIVVLYDRYQPIHGVRFGDGGAAIRRGTPRQRGAHPPGLVAGDPGRSTGDGP